MQNPGRAIAQAVSRRLPTAAEPRSGHVGFVVDKVALGQVFSEYFGFSCQFPFHRLLHIHPLSSGAGTVGQTVADVPSGLSLTPPQETEEKKTNVESQPRWGPSEENERRHTKISALDSDPRTSSRRPQLYSYTIKFLQTHWSTYGGIFYFYSEPGHYKQREGRKP
jgi:hypothetical protein